MKTKPRSEKNRYYNYRAQCFNVIRHQDAPLRNTWLKGRIPIPIYMQNLNSKKKVQRNSYFAHTDHLLGMGTDEDLTVREEDVSMLIKIRDDNQKMEECTDKSDEEETEYAAAVDVD